MFVTFFLVIYFKKEREGENINLRGLRDMEDLGEVGKRKHNKIYFI